MKKLIVKFFNVSEERFYFHVLVITMPLHILIGLKDGWITGIGFFVFGLVVNGVYYLLAKKESSFVKRRQEES